MIGMVSSLSSGYGERMVEGLLFAAALVVVGLFGFWAFVHFTNRSPRK
jgi:hypothetical protein